MESLSLRRPAGAVLAAALAALAAAAPGFAAPRKAPPRAIAYSANEMTPRVSQCLIRRERGTVEKWLLTLPGSRAEARLVAAAEARFPPCFDRWGHRIGGWIPTYDRPGMRAGLVRALLQARRDALPASPPPDSAWPGLAADSDEAEAAAALLAADLGLCLARRHWGNVLAIVRAVDPAAEAMHPDHPKAIAARRREQAAVESQLSAMIPSIAGCVPAGARLRIERPRLRSLVEEAAYHLTRPEAQAFNGG